MSTTPVTREQLDQVLAEENVNLTAVVAALTGLAAADAKTIKDLQAAIATGRGDYTPEFKTLTDNNTTLQNALAAIKAQTASDVAADVITPVATTITLTGPTTGAAHTALSFSGSVAETNPVTTPAPVPTGTVTLSDSTGAVSGSGSLASGNFAIVLTAGLAAGTYSVEASYGGDAANTASVSPTLTVVVS